MIFEELLDQAIDMLRRCGRLTYRALKLQFHLDDDTLDILTLQRHLILSFSLLCSGSVSLRSLGSPLMLSKRCETAVPWPSSQTPPSGAAREGEATGC